MTSVLLILLTIFKICQSDVQIFDYSNSQLIPIHLGQAKLQNGNFKLIHVLNLTNYESAINQLETEVYTKIMRNSTILPFLLHDMTQVKQQLEIIKPRKKRSLDILGTAWKWLAGTPDHEDHEIVLDRIKGLLENNEKQRIINKNTVDRINSITNSTNAIIKAIQTIEEVRKIQEDAIVNKLRILKEEIINVEYALQWAKVGVINSFILSEKEIEEARTFLDLEKFPYNDIEQALSFATIKIATNNLDMIYIINLPAIDNKNCERLLIKPIKKNDRIIKLNTENVIKCDNEIYEIKEDCKEYNKLCICPKQNLVNISESNCIPPLLSSKTHDCVIINNQHIASIQELYPGTILLNQFEGFIKFSSNKTNELSGTYLLQFHNDTVIINNQTFVSKEISGWKPLPALLQPNNNNERMEEVLSLELIKDLQANNIDSLNLISTKGKVVFSINLIISIILIIFLLAMSLKFWSKTKKGLTVNNIINESSLPQTPSHRENSGALDQRCEFRSINDLPIC